MTASPTPPIPRRLRALRLSWLLLVLALAWVLSGHRQRPGPHPPVALTIAQADGTRTALMAASGWPLTLNMQVKDVDFLGFGHQDATQELPRWDDVGYLVFDNPDGCPSWLSPDWQRWLADGNGDTGGFDDLEPCRQLSLPWPRDERWLEVTPGVTVPEPEVCGQRPFLRTFSFDDGQNAPPDSDRNRDLQEVGPCVGNLQDGYGYGAHHRLPGLVVLADSGPGVVTDEFFDRPFPMQARNLAGFFQSISYQVMSADGHTRVSAHMNVPAGLLAPLVVVDQSAPGLCDDGGGSYYIEATRVDGGPVLCESQFDANQHVVTVRAFVVDGHADDTWQDIDGDGDVDADDAVAAGHVLLSNMATFQFRQLSETPELEVLLVDLDGNGDAGSPPVGPAGPGGLTPPPR